MQKNDSNSSKKLGHSEKMERSSKNYQFQGEIMVGNPPQPIIACFDTGSANAWIIGKELHDKLAHGSLAEDTIEHEDA